MKGSSSGQKNPVKSHISSPQPPDGVILDMELSLGAVRDSPTPPAGTMLDTALADRSVGGGTGQVSSPDPPQGTIVDTALVRETAAPPAGALLDTALADAEVSEAVPIETFSSASTVENHSSNAKGMSVAEWKAQQVEEQKKATISTRERLREEYAKAAQEMNVGDRCVVSGNRGVIAFLGDDVEGLPGGFWVGVRYDEPVGKNDGRVKGVVLFACQPNYGHVVRPDKVIVVDPSTPPRSQTNLRRGSSASPRRLKRADPFDGKPNSTSAMHLKRSISTSPPPQPRWTDSSTPSPPFSKASLARWTLQDPEKVIGSDPSVEDTMPRQRVGMVYDARMEEHECKSSRDHPERPARISSIFCTLAETGLAQRCVRIAARPALDSELRTVHTAEHVQQLCAVQGLASQAELDKLARQYNSVFLCPNSTSSALLAAGSVVEATKRVCCGEIGKAVCVVRPPGHHALPGCAMGFCLFANVAVAAAEARRKGWANRVLILDWDVHLGNGTQAMFFSDPSVLVFSIHRYDNGAFYPGGPDGDMDQVGKGEGKGFNVNVPWPRGGAGDADYQVVMDELFLPIAREFKPDLVLVSAGFDAAAGDPLGGCKVTPAGFAMMTRALRTFASGKVVLALEGGYSLRATADSLAACVSALLNDPPAPTASSPTRPSTSASAAPASPAAPGKPLFEETVRRVVAVHAAHWQCCKSRAAEHAAQRGEAEAAEAAGGGGAAEEVAGRQRDGIEGRVESLGQRLEAVRLGRRQPVVSPPDSCTAVRASSPSSGSSSDEESWGAWNNSSGARIASVEAKEEEENKD